MATVQLRELGRHDYPTLSAWLREPDTAVWWHDDPALTALEAKYGPSIDGTDPTHVLIAEVDDEAVGLIQWFWWRDEPSYLAEVSEVLEVPTTAASIDYLIGASERRGRGLGRAMITAVLKRAWAAGASAVIVPVHADNGASRAVLLRCGFDLIAEGSLEPDNPDHDRRHVIYRIDRPADSS